MANTGLIQLGAIRVAAQQRADMQNSNFVTTTEWNDYITRSYKELYDLLISHYGDMYVVAPAYTFNTSSGIYQYPLPDGLTTVDSVTSLVAAPFYKLIGIDLQITASPDTWYTLKRFEWTERNKFWLANQYAIYGIIALRYCVFGGNLWLTPVPVPTQTLQMWYVPKPTNLQATLTCGTTSSSSVITTSDTSQLAVGMSVFDTILPQGVTSVIPSGSTIASITTNTSFSISPAAATATQSSYLLSCWSDATTLDGISGWEEYVIVDAALKAIIKEESDPSALMGQKADIARRIGEMAENRDASMPSRVSDTRSIDLGCPGGFGDYGDGYGY